MRPDVLLRIIASCRTLDETSEAFYGRLAEGAPGPLAALWRRLAADEQGCVRYWSALEAVVRDGGAPHLFDWPFSVEDELRVRVERAQAGSTSGASAPDHAFAEALRVELLRLHPAVVALLQYGRDLGGLIGLDSPIEVLDGHLGALVESAEAHGAPNPERELLGEAVLELWRELRSAATRGVVDPLTGLLNRRGLLGSAEVLAQLARRQGSRLAVLVVGVDHLKEVNDRHGDDAGDAALKGVATALEAALRRSDELGRTGGDEFTVVALTPTEAPEVDLARLAEKLRQPWPAPPGPRSRSP
jgi:GGDEF domain-containing protein